MQTLSLESNMKKILALTILLSGVAFAEGSVGPDVRIHSDVLGYDLQYRVYLPENHEGMDDLAVLFVTDGQGYIRQGRMPDVLDSLIDSDRIKPVVTVFVDPRDPDNLDTNRRNQQFFCNADYLRFYNDELIPEIERAYPVATDRAARTILGVSFGALNAACFGLMGHETFSGIAMHSPANHPVQNLLPDYQSSPTLPLKIFLSTGEPNDNTQSNRRFRDLLRDKGYPLQYEEVPQGHDWDNWRPLVDDVLLYFYQAED
jgi:enterochelin esterase-like enzyme